jgi:HEAT repeat protein
MKSRKVMALTGLVVVFGTVMLIIFQRPRDPVYQGKRLSAYLEAFASDGIQMNDKPPFSLVGLFQPSAERRRAWDVLPEFGTNALPTLVQWLKAKDTAPERWLVWLGRKQSFIRLRRLTAEERRVAAVTAFSRLGHRAEAAVPSLIPLLRDANFARQAIFALNWIQPDREQDILALTNAFGVGSIAEIEAMAALASFQSRAAGAIPSLMIKLEATNSATRAAAAVALARIGASAEEIVPLITRNLQAGRVGFDYPAPGGRMNLWALGEFAERARGALPIISNFVNDADSRVREEAKTAIEKIRGRSEEGNALP